METRSYACADHRTVKMDVPLVKINPIKKYYRKFAKWVAKIDTWHTEELLLQKEKVISLTKALNDSNDHGRRLQNHIFFLESCDKKQIDQLRKLEQTVEDQAKCITQLNIESTKLQNIQADKLTKVTDTAYAYFEKLDAKNPVFVVGQINDETIDDKDWSQFQARIGWLIKRYPHITGLGLFSTRDIVMTEEAVKAKISKEVAERVDAAIAAYIKNQTLTGSNVEHDEIAIEAVEADAEYVSDAFVDDCFEEHKVEAVKEAIAEHKEQPQGTPCPKPLDWQTLSSRQTS